MNNASAQNFLKIDDILNVYEDLRPIMPPYSSAHTSGQAAKAARMRDLLDHFDALMLDGFGVLNVGREIIPGAVELLTMAAEKDIPVLVVTNGATQDEQVIGHKYAQMGLPISPPQVVSSRAAITHWLTHNRPPQWHYIGRRRVPWTVLEYVGTTDRLKCRYAGTVVFNRELIGNDGVKEFELTHQFVSRETLLEMLPSEPRFPYRQIRAKRFRCYDRRGSVAIEPGTMVSRFTEQSRCPHCKTPLFERELSTMCCFNGKFVLPRGRPNPPELEQMLNNREFPKCASR